jgi:hypothetical protein
MNALGKLLASLSMLCAALFLAPADAQAASRSNTTRKPVCSRPGQDLSSCRCTASNMQTSVNGRLCVCAVGRGYEARNGQCARTGSSRRGNQGNQGAAEQESNESQSSETAVAKGGKGSKGSKRGKKGAAEEESNESQSSETAVAKGGKRGGKGGNSGKRACSSPGDDLSTCACTAKHMIVSPNGKKCVCDVPNGWVASSGRCVQGDDKN